MPEFLLLLRSRVFAIQPRWQIFDILVKCCFVVQGRSQNFTLGPQKLSDEGARIEAPKAPRGIRIREGVSPPNQLGNLGSVISSRSGVRPPTHFWHIWGPQKTSGRENSVTLLCYFTSFFRKNPLNRRLGACPPFGYAPCRSVNFISFAILNVWSPLICVKTPHYFREIQNICILLLTHHPRR